ncbi:polysaccharide deacetylase family protein [Bacteroidota bacterium]
MTILNIIYQKLYYIFLDILIPKKQLIIPSFLNKSKNIFIYFDYEREFGGHHTTISDNDVYYILELLKTNGFQSTWYTVGKIFKKYPETIKNIIREGHEIGSHTYSHIVPLHTSEKELKNDFLKIVHEADEKINITGFHSPRGRWSCNAVKQLVLNNYKYEIVGARKKEPFIPYFIVNNNKRLFRLHTIGDDWPLFNKNRSEIEVFEYFISTLNSIKHGNIVGIGFHPWVLFSHINIIKGFEKFINHLGLQKDIRLETANYYVKTLESLN